MWKKLFSSLYHLDIFWVLEYSASSRVLGWPKSSGFTSLVVTYQKLSVLSYYNHTIETHINSIVVYHYSRRVVAHYSCRVVTPPLPLEYKPPAEALGTKKVQMTNEYDLLRDHQIPTHNHPKVLRRRSMGRFQTGHVSGSTSNLKSANLTKTSCF